MQFAVYNGQPVTASSSKGLGQQHMPPVIDVEGGCQYAEEEGECLLANGVQLPCSPHAMHTQQPCNRTRSPSSWHQSASRLLWCQASLVMASAAARQQQIAQQLARLQTACAGAALRSRLIVLACLLLVSVALSNYFDVQKLQAMVEQLHEVRLGSIVVFVLLFAAAVVLMLPGMLLSIGAGAAYGWSIGVCVAWLGTVLGQLGAFALGRYLLRDVVYNYMVQRVPSFTAFDQRVGEEGWKLVLLLRLSPVLPYNIMNYALGITSIELVPYALSSAVAAVPYACLFAYLGSSSADLYQLLHDGAGSQLSPELLICLSCVMILSVVGLFFMCKHAIMAPHANSSEIGSVSDAAAEVESISSSSSHSSSRILVMRLGC